MTLCMDDRRVILGLCVGALVALAAVILRLKAFSIDEMQYAHAAWLVAHGSVPYRDFFEVHFPLLYLALAPLSRLLPGAPWNQLLGFREAMAVALAVSVLAVQRWGSWLAVGILLTLAPFVQFAVEIRPDAVACAGFLLALALTVKAGGRRNASSWAGLAAGLAVFGTQKIVVAELCLVLPFWSGQLHRRAFLAGVLAGLLPVAAYLTVHHVWGDFAHWCFVWAAEHERGYPPLAASAYWVPLWWNHAVLFSLAGLGIAAELRERRALLPLAALTSLLSIVLQRAAFPYSYLAFLGVCAGLAALGLMALARRWPMWLVALGTLGWLGSQAVETARLLDFTNRAQERVLAKVEQLTAPDDRAYDNSGGFIARPHAFWFFYTDAYLRTVMIPELEGEAPAALLAQHTVLKLTDLREAGLPQRLRDFLSAHYQPYDGDLHLWGQHYAPASSAQSFLAVKRAQYFIEPPAALEQGHLQVDGREVRAAPFLLEAGPHTVHYQGAAPAFDILWLPRNGEAWHPDRDARPSYSQLL